MSENDEEDGFVCAISGKSEEASFPDNSDGLGNMPAGWTRVTIQRRQFNTRWLAIQATKEKMLRGLMMQPGVDQTEEQEMLIRIQLDAQFHALESATPIYEVDIDETVYLSDADDIVSDVDEIRKMLGLDPLPTESEAAVGDSPDSPEA